MTRRKLTPVNIPRVFSIDWPPGFVSAIRVDPRTKKFESDFARQQRNRSAGGWDSHPLGMPGSKPYTSAGPVQMMESKA